MRLHPFLATGLAALAAVSLGAQTRAVPDSHKAMLAKYCFTCHSSKMKSGGLALDVLDLSAAHNDAKTWEKALRKLRGHLMPPPGAAQPSQADVDSFVAWMETRLDANKTSAKAGHVPVQRLNRTEYAAAVKSLVGVDVAKDVLPADIEVEGFDNVAAALTVSPSFLDQFVTSARHVAKLAVGSPTPRVSNAKYGIAANTDTGAPVPPGLRGAVRFKHNFPADGEYRFNFNDLDVGLYTGAVENESTLVLMVDGKILFRKSIGGPKDLALAGRKASQGRAEIMERFSKIPIQVEAGVHDVVAGFIERSRVESDDFVGTPYTGLNGFGAGNDRMARLKDGIEITGPFNAKGISTTESRALIFVCDPKKAGEAACAKQITESLARRAFRRPVNAEDMAKLMPFYQAGRENGGSFDQGVEQVVAAVLASPEFLYRSIRGPKLVKPASEVPLTDLELASRLSFFLWTTGPDEQLLKLAAAGGLRRPGVLEAQVRRMLADARASSLVSSFAMKWLNLDDLETVKPDPEIFRGFTDQMRRDFSQEAEAFVASVLLEDRPVMDLLTSNETFLNDRLARHYGVEDVTGSQFRKVKLTQPERAGLLGKAAVLMRSSYPDRTSPVLRGAWVLDKLLGTPPAPPPPNVETNLSQPAGEKPKTVRQRLEEHRSKPTCRQCHGVIDPTGLALENFDSIGSYRTVDRQANQPIDAATVLPNGVAINGVNELRAQLTANPETFVRAVTEKLMMYALNRELEAFDMPQIRGVVRRAAKDNYKFSSIIQGIVATEAFRKQRPDGEAKHPVAVAAK